MGAASWLGVRAGGAGERGAAARGTGVVEDGQTGHGVSVAGEERLQQGALLLLSPEGLRVRGG